MFEEYTIHVKSVGILSKAAESNKKIYLSAMLLSTYALELGLKCLSFLSHNGSIYQITRAKFNANKDLLPTGIYIINQGSSL